jgi:hypothetical protein
VHDQSEAEDDARRVMVMAMAMAMAVLVESVALMLQKKLDMITKIFVASRRFICI